MARDIHVKATIEGGSIHVNASLSSSILAAAVSLGQTVIQYVGETNPYTGVYEVDPDFNGVTLETQRKYLTDDLTVNPIQVESVSNTSGGRTVYIGGII